MTVLTIELTCEVYPTQPLGPYVQSHDLENPLMKSLPLHYSDCHMPWLPMLYKGLNYMVSKISSFHDSIKSFYAVFYSSGRTLLLPQLRQSVWVPNGSWFGSQ